MFLILDRYLLKNFLLTLIFTILALCMIFVLVNLLESLDGFLDSNAGFLVIVKYYLYFLPEIIKMMLPIAVLSSILFSVGKLSSNNEITAMKTGSMSLYRIMLPFIIVTLAISFFMLYFNGWLVPNANSKKFEIERIYLKRSASIKNLTHLYFRDTPSRNVYMMNYEPAEKKGINIYIDEFNPGNKVEIIKRIEAQQISWDDNDNSWVLKKGFIRNIIGDIVVLQRFDSLHYKLETSNQQIKELKKTTDEMTFDELKSVIDLQIRSGKDVRKQLIEYYGNYAFPFASIIVVLFAVPFSSIRNKSGVAVQIAAAMIISFVYLVFLKVSQTIGFSLNINPIITGWSSNVIFLIFGIFNLLKTKT